MLIIDTNILFKVIKDVSIGGVYCMRMLLIISGVFSFFRLSISGVKWLVLLLWITW